MDEATEERLLILDDDPAVGHVICTLAEKLGIRTRFTTRHDEFLEVIRTWAPSIIAVDLVMPDMDGVQVLANLAGLHCPARVIITSGMGGRVLDAARRAAAEHGLDILGVLPKPFSSAQFRELLQAGGAASVTPSARRTLRQGTPGTAITAPLLERAIGDGELIAYLQPKISCASGAVAGFEALARWRHPGLGLVPPDQFIPLAESAGLVDKLTDRVFDDALAWLAAVTAQRKPDTPPVHLSMNLSARSLSDRGLVDRMVAHCRRWQVPPESIVLELTETSAMEDPVASLELLTRLRMRGFSLSIDDFGTGYSSMVQLVRLPFSEVKVDKSFVMTAGRSEESRAVVQSIVGLGRNLGLRSTAEGVEDAATLAYLRDIGCDFAQGFFVARPMPAAEATDWLNAYVPSPGERR